MCLIIRFPVPDDIQIEASSILKTLSEEASVVYTLFLKKHSSCHVFASRFDLKLSNPELLEFSDDNKSCKRIGNSSISPCAICNLPSEQSIFSVKLEESSNINTNTNSNKFTIGLSRLGQAIASSDGFGISPNSWFVGLTSQYFCFAEYFLINRGLVDDRSNETEPAMFVGTCGTKSCSFSPRKLTVGDEISVIADLSSGTVTISVNHGEFSHTFGDAQSSPSSSWYTGPKGHCSEFFFGVTLGENIYPLFKFA